MKRALDVLYIDNHLLVVNKPAGMLVQGDVTGDLDLLSLGKAYIKEKFNKPGNVFLGLVHRLDRPVSGVVVFARTSKAAARLSEQFRQRTPEKRYIALLEGACKGGGQRVDYLARQGRQVKVVDPSYPKARKCVLQWRALAQREGLTLVEVDLKTGRKHQIRIQLAQMGHPILGDFRYGAKRGLDGRNLALHSYRLGIMHPTRREPMYWSAPPPPSWGQTFSREIAQMLEQ